MAKSSTTARGGKRSTSEPLRLPADNHEQYEREADALISLLEIEFGDTDEGADIADLRHRPIMKGVERHMRELYRRADFMNPLTLRRFYVELRLWGDMLAAVEAQGILLIEETDIEELS